MLEKLITGALNRYQDQLLAHGRTPDTSRWGRMAYEEDGLPGLVAMFISIERARAYTTLGADPDEELSTLTVAGYIAGGFIHVLRVLAGNIPAEDDIAWELYRPEPAPSPNRMLPTPVLSAV